jgi:hypothetical protein
MGIVGAKKEKYNRYAEKELFRGCVLGSIIDLLPHVEVIISASIELEWYPSHPVEHKEGAEHVGDVCQCPGGFL